MATFPTLKTGAVAQYPLTSGYRFATQQVRFLDGSRHVFPLQKALRRWIIQFDQIDPEEFSVVAAFVEATLGQTFSFTDPGSGIVAPKCMLQGSAVEFQTLDEFRSKLQITVEEVL